MSGTTDTSQPADRVRFCNIIESGAPAAGLAAATTAVANCPLRMPETTAYLLDLPATATYAQAAALVQLRWSSGRAAF